MEFEEIIEKFKNKKLEISFDKDVKFLMEETNHYIPINNNISGNLSYFLSYLNGFKELYIEQAISEKIDLSDKKNEQYITNEKKEIIIMIKRILKSNKTLDILNSESEYKREDFDIYKNYFIETEDNIEDTKKLIYLVKIYREYVGHVNQNNRIYSQKSNSLDKRLKSDGVSLTDEENQKTQAIYDIFEYLNKVSVDEGKDNYKFDNFILSENEELLKLMIKEGTSLDEFFEKNSKMSKKLKYKYDDLMSVIGSEYVEYVIPILMRTQKALEISEEKLIYDFQNEAFLKTETEACDELVAKLEKLLIIEEDYEKKKKEEDKLKKEQQLLKEKLEEAEIKRKEEEMNKALKLEKEKKEREAEKRKPIQKEEGKSKEFSNKIEELRNSIGPKEKVIPIFLQWYDKNNKDFSSKKLESFRKTFFKTIKDIEEKTKTRVSLFIFSDGNIEESKKILRQVKEEASKNELNRLVEGITAQRGSYAIDENGDITKMCIMSSQIYDKIVDISKNMFGENTDKYIKLNQDITSYVSFKYEDGDDNSLSYSKFLAKRAEKSVKRTYGNHEIYYRPYIGKKNEGIDVLLYEQENTQNKITEYYQNKYYIDKTFPINFTRVIEEMEKKKKTKGRESNYDNEEIK